MKTKTIQKLAKIANFYRESGLEFILGVLLFFGALIGFDRLLSKWNTSNAVAFLGACITVGCVHAIVSPLLGRRWHYILVRRAAIMKGIETLRVSSTPTPQELQDYLIEWYSGYGPYEATLATLARDLEAIKEDIDNKETQPK